MINAISVGKKIAEGRKEIAISQVKLAELLNISPQAVSKWERGEALPDIVMLNQIAAVFNKDLNYFSETQGNPQADNQEKSKDIPNGGESRTQSEKADKQGSDSTKYKTLDMSFNNWKNGDFSYLKNQNGKFSFSNIENCRFDFAALNGSSFKANNVNNCSFESADLKFAKFAMANIEKNSFTSAALNGAEFIGSNVDHNDFSGADLSGVKISGCNFDDNKACGIIFKNTEFKNCNIKNVVFDSDITDCSFAGCVFNKTEFKNVTFTNCFFKGGSRSMKKAVFTDCRADSLTYSFLSLCKADLSGITKI